jgi:hypothetical protein
MSDRKEGCDELPSHYECFTARWLSFQGGGIEKSSHTQAAGYTRQLDACTKLNAALKQLN